jgi:beta-lactamase class D
LLNHCVGGKNPFWKTIGEHPRECINSHIAISLLMKSNMTFRIFALILALALTLLGLPSAQANETLLATAFLKKSGCFLLSDIGSGKTLIAYNAPRCTERRAPYSTFKIPLSLMAFDKNLMTQETVFPWDGKDKGRTPWNRDQTPRSWIADSVVWVSQALTHKLGLETIKTYLKRFDYGNCDFSGGIDHAWLGSSLQISGQEQATFLTNLATHKLGVSNKATDSTIANMFIDTLPNGWALYGKTGSGLTASDKRLREGWFVGFLKRGEQKLIFVVSFNDIEEPAIDQPAGFVARDIAKKLLTDYISTEK